MTAVEATRTTAVEATKTTTTSTTTTNTTATPVPLPREKRQMPPPPPQEPTTVAAAGDGNNEKENVRLAAPLPVDRQWLVKLMKRHYGADYDCQTKPITVLAPMVDASDLPFRLLTRRYNCRLCFTPMIHCRLFAKSKPYRAKFHLLSQQNLEQQDRPLIAQLCGSDLDACLYTALAVAPYCDAIDINCGCPQQIAKRGNYGAFLLEQDGGRHLLALVRHLVQHVPLPITVKVRLLPAATRDESLQQSLALYRQLVHHGGIHMLTIHARTRLQKGPATGRADWEAIQTVVQELGRHIPILANGSMASAAEAWQCLQTTSADGVMSSEAILEYPALFAEMDELAASAATAQSSDEDEENDTTTRAPRPTRTIGRVALALEYLQLAQQYPPNVHGQGSGVKCLRAHVHRILHADLQADTTLRSLVIDATTWQGLWDAVQAVRQQQQQSEHVVAEEQLSWYRRYRTTVQVGGVHVRIGPPDVEKKKHNKESMERDGDEEEDNDEDDEQAATACRNCLFGQDEDADY